MSAVLQRLADTGRRHRQLQQPGSHGIMDRVGDDRAHGDDRRFAASLRGRFRILDQYRLDPGQPV